MIKYKNISSYPLSFYGITFNPNEEKEFPGYINHPKVFRVQDRVEAKPRATVEVAKVTSETKAKVDEVKPKRQYNRKVKNQ